MWGVCLVVNQPKTKREGRENSMKSSHVFHAQVSFSLSLFFLNHFIETWCTHTENIIQYFYCFTRCVQPLSLSSLDFYFKKKSFSFSCHFILYHYQLQTTSLFSSFNFPILDSYMNVIIWSFRIDCFHVACFQSYPWHVYSFNTTLSLINNLLYVHTIFYSWFLYFIMVTYIHPCFKH